MIKITGKIIFDPQGQTKKQINQSSWKNQMIIQIGGEMDLYYSKFIEKAHGIHLIRPQRLAHLTIVADRYSDHKKWNEVKKKYDGKYIEIGYDPNLSCNDQYWWLRAECPIGDKIRKELNLGTPFFPYHITVGNVKELELDHNTYVLKMYEDRFMKTLTRDEVNELRQRTGLGIGICKKALARARGDMDKAELYARRLETRPQF